MNVFDDPTTMRAWSLQQRQHGEVVAVVPTMGALHSGHFELVRVARTRATRVIVTIFVNPLQFNQPTDFDKYPRPIDDDLAACEAAGVDAVYAPTSATMYPANYQTHVEPGALADRFEGAMRPGHFRGVTTVVTKLFGATAPDLACFGQKDFQQLAIIQSMTADLDLGIDIVAVPTMREPDGLAMSSRNRRLTPQDRAAAVIISAALNEAQRSFDQGENSAPQLAADALATIQGEPRASVEYVEIADAATLEPIDVIDRRAVILTAVWFGDVRLIDNIVLDPTTTR